MGLWRQLSTDERVSYLFLSLGLRPKEDEETGGNRLHIVILSLAQNARLSSLRPPAPPVWQTQCQRGKDT